jgi:hypothetical protein
LTLFSGRKNSLLDDMAAGQPSPPKTKRIPMIVDLVTSSAILT